MISNVVLGSNLQQSDSVIYSYIYIYYIHIYAHVHVSAKSLQLYLTLCDPINYNLPGFSVHGILQTRILEWVAMPSPRGSSTQGLNLMSPALAARFFTTSATWEAYTYVLFQILFHYKLLQDIECSSRCIIVCPY